MNIEHSEYLELQIQLQDHFDGRYVKIEDCENTVETFSKNLNRDFTEIAVIKTKLNQITWLLSTVAAGIVTMIIKMFFGT